MKEGLLDDIGALFTVVMNLLLIETIFSICSCVSSCNRNDKLDRIEAALSQIATTEKGAAK